MSAPHFASASGVFTPDGFADALSRFGASIRPSVLRSLRRSAAIPRAIYMAKARKRGVLRSIFGSNPKGLGGLVKTKVVDKGNVFVLAMELKGLAAMQEIGGHTKQPRRGAIYPKNAKALKLKVPSLGVVIVASAQHRGANIATFPAAEAAMAAAAPRIRLAIEKEIAKFEANGVRIASSTAA